MCWLRNDFVDAGYGMLIWIVGWGEKRIRRQRDQITALSYIGKSGWQNSFGGNLLIDNDLQRKTG
jgi:hypothetical protein